MTVGGAIRAIVLAMTAHADREEVAAAGCSALFNLTWSEREVRARALLDGAVGAVRGALERFGAANTEIHGKATVILRALADSGSWLG
jgi:hypothetical protein